MSAEQEKIIRPIANFPPSIWGDQFLVYDQVPSKFVSLYEATFLRVPGEVILEDALTFTRVLLDNMAKDPECFNNMFSIEIQRALKQPIRKRLPRLEAIHYIPFYQQQASHNKSLLKLAKLGFELLQLLHKKELSQLSKWWKAFDVPKNYPYARNRLVECYFWAQGVYFEPEYSQSRIFLAKTLAVITILDDTYDSYGIYEELMILTEAIGRWSIECLDMLPEYMKQVYQMVLDLDKDMEEIMSKNGKAHHLIYWKEVMKEYIGSYMVEAKWRKEGYTPTPEEHTSVALISCGYKFLQITSLVGMGDIITDESFKWALAFPPLVKASCTLCRFQDDIVTHKEEQERNHVAFSVECYVKEFDFSEEHVIDLFLKKVESAWADMNLESLACKDVPMPLIMRVINLVRVIEVLYKYQDNFTHVKEELQYHIKALLIDSMSK